jgi:hypothetical protein
MVADNAMQEQGVDKGRGAVLAILGLLSLAGCDSRKPASPQPAPPEAAAVNPDAGVTTYRCRDGQEIVAGYPDADTAIVTYKGHAYPLKRAAGDASAPYTGFGLQWQARGRAAELATLAPGESRAARPGLSCVAAAPAPADPSAVKL